MTESEVTTPVYTSRINAFRDFVKARFHTDIEELKHLWREAKYSSIQDREKFLDWLADITEAYAVYLKQQGFKVTTRHSNLSVVQSYLHKGCRIKECDVDLPKRLFITYHNRDITKEEIRKILEHCTLREKLFYLMMVEMGVRPRTIVKLKYWMIKEDFEAERVPMKIELPSEILKDRIGDRFTFIGEDAFKLLKEYLSLRPNIKDDDLILQPEVKARMKKPYLSPETFSNKFSDLVLELGLVERTEKGKPKKLRMYCLRKYFKNNTYWDSMYRKFWSCHKSVEDHYIAKDVEKHRQEYVKGYTHLGIYERNPIIRREDIERIVEARVKEKVVEIGQLREQVERLRQTQEEWEEKIKEKGIFDAVVAEVTEYVDKLLEDPKYAERALKKPKKASD